MILIIKITATLPNKPKEPTAVPIDVLVQRGSPKLTCPEPFGYPVPYVAWVRDGVVYQNSTTDLVFSGSVLTNRRNQSVWECVVTNKHGTDFHQFIVEGKQLNILAVELFPSSVINKHLNSIY